MYKMIIFINPAIIAYDNILRVPIGEKIVLNTYFIVLYGT